MCHLLKSVVITALFPICAWAAKLPLAERLTTDEWETRKPAVIEAKGLGAFEKRELAGSLIKKLKNGRPAVRRYAAEALEVLGPAGRRAVPHLIRAADKGAEGALRMAAVDALGAVGTADPRVVPALLAIVKSNSSEYVRGAAAQALGKIGPATPEVIPALVAVLAKESPESPSAAARGAVRALGRIGPKAKDAAPYLIRAFKGIVTYMDALSALSDIGAPAIPRLIEALSDSDPRIRKWSATTLGAKKLAPLAGAAAPHLIPLLRDKEMGVREAAAFSLGAITPRSDAVIAALVSALADSLPPVREAAAAALARIGAPALGAILRALKAEDPRARRAAVSALGKGGLASGRTAAALTARLKDDAPDVRRAAADLLAVYKDATVRRALRAYRERERGAARRMWTQYSPEELKTLFVSLRRTACYGTCPVYRVEIHGDGKVFFLGRRFVKTTGIAQAEIAAPEIKKLLAALQTVNYFSLNDSYESHNVTDNPFAITSVRFKGRKKQIVHYHGDVSAPQSLRMFEDRIDALAGTARWIGDSD